MSQSPKKHIMEPDLSTNNNEEISGNGKAGIAD